MSQYVELVGLLHPNVECHAKGPLYSDIVWKNTIIAKATLDAEIPNIETHRKDINAKTDLDDMKVIKALVIWLAPLVGKSKAQARSEIIAIYKAL